MEFEEAHGLFIDQHMKSRTGERRGRLVRGHNFAEKLFLQNVWWPMFESLDDLHPEYEVYDWNRKSQFLDFAFLPQTGSSFGIECDGYQSHVKDMDREKFNYSVNRDTFLTGMGWRMIHFSLMISSNVPRSAGCCCNWCWRLTWRVNLLAQLFYLRRKRFCVSLGVSVNRFVQRMWPRISALISVRRVDCCNH